MMALSLTTIVLLASLSWPLAAVAIEGDPVRGELVFATCASCHEAKSTKEKVGPGLKGLFARPKLLSNGKKPTEPIIRGIIDKGGQNMPSFSALPERQKSDLLAYLKTL